MRLISILSPFLFLAVIACQSSGKKVGIKKAKSPQITGSNGVNSVTNKSERRYPRTLNNESVTASPLNTKQLLANSGANPSSLQMGKSSVALTEKEKVFFELAGEKIDQLSEIEVYKKVVEKYQSSDIVALKAYSNLLLKKYPRSIYCDNALYLEGMMYFSEKKYGESLNSFQKILTNYPQSNKAVSALFAKGIIFKKMNLNKEAISLLAQVINKFPGSPESIRAEVEIKVVTQN